MNVFSLKTILLGLVVACSADAAQQTLRLNYNDYEMQGQQTIYLKRDLESTYGHRFNWQFAQLYNVRMVAKSEFGRAVGTLVVNNSNAAAQNIPGNPQNFRNPAPQTFARIDLGYRGNSQGPWQVDLNGHVILRAIEVTFDDGAYPPPPPPPPAQGGRVCIVSVNGTTHCFTEPVYLNDLRNNGWNDVITSLIVEGNMSIEVCEHIDRGGRCEVFMQSATFVSGSPWYRTISSLRVMRRHGPPQPQPQNRVCIYSGYFSGASHCFYNPTRIDNLIPNGWNDAISSILIEGNLAISVCDGINRTVECIDFAQSVSFAPGSQFQRWDKVISSLNVYPRFGPRR